MNTSVYFAVMNSVSAASWPARSASLRAPLTFEPGFVETGGRQRLDAADIHEIEQRAAGEAPAVDLKHIGMEG